MVNVNFKPSKEYVEKAFAAFDVLEGRKGRGSDFLGWMDIPWIQSMLMVEIV